jgi:hypothetical protein
MKNTTNREKKFGKFVCPDLPRPSLAEGDSYSGGGVKTSAADASTTTARSRQ